MNLVRKPFGIVPCLRLGLSAISRSLTFHAAAVAAVMVTSVASAQITIPSANLGSDGSLNPFQNRLITLGSAVTGQWDQAGTGFGVYDAEKWAVVYKYNSVNIPAGVTVTFANHPSGAPVVWLVNGDVTIGGTVNLSGLTGGANAFGYAAGGPGGFRGGQGRAPASAGFGPGGGNGTPNPSEGGGFGSFGNSGSGDVGGYVYGTAELIPLIGGSGGGPGPGSAGGGGGGGAILVIATGTISLNGGIVSNGGNGATDLFGSGSAGGSGGGIRLVANTISGNASGSLQCIGGSGAANGGFGRIRTEANLDTLPTEGIPVRSRATVGTTAILWPDATKPKITTVSLGDKPVPSDPRGLFTFGNTDVELNAATPAQLTIQAQNVPLNATLEIRIVPVTQNQGETRLNASFQSGSFANSTWRATLPVTNGVSSITVSVIMP